MRPLTAWKTCAAALLIAIACPRPAFAQGEPRMSVAGGYVYLQQHPTGGLESPVYPLGWMATTAFRLGSSRLSAVGEVGLSYRTTGDDERQQLLGLLGGARFAVYSSKHITIFAQGLAGLERFAEPGLAESGVAVQPGAGLDVLLSPRLFLRAQGDYRWSQPSHATIHSYRFVVAIGVRIE